MSVRLRVGLLAGVDPALLASAYPLVAAGTCAEGSSLVIDAVPVQVRCRRCQQLSAAEPNRLTCRGCGDSQTEVVGGTELLLESVQLNLSCTPGQKSEPTPV